MIFIENGNYPRYIGDLKLVASNWQEGDPLPEGWEQVADTPVPDFVEFNYSADLALREAGDSLPTYEQVIEIAPVRIDGGLARAWEVRELDPEVVQAQRDRGDFIKTRLSEGATIDEILIELGES